MISKGGTFVGRHVCVPLEGAAVLINAFNFPVWGMLEKMSTALLAGVPVDREAGHRDILSDRAAVAPLDGGVRHSADGGVSAAVWQCRRPARPPRPARTPWRSPGRRVPDRCSRRGAPMIEHSVRFNQEADSLNFSMLGPDARPGTEEFDLFIKEVVREMTVKAGQKCTAIRRTIVPAATVDDVIAALKKRLDGVTIGDPGREGVRMGPLAGKTQVKEVGQSVDKLRSVGRSRIRRLRPHDARGCGPRPRSVLSRRCCSTTTARSSGRRRTKSRRSDPSTP